MGMHLTAREMRAITTKAHEEIEYQRKVYSSEYRVKRITDGFCVSLVSEQGAECVCKELGFALGESFIMS